MHLFNWYIHVTEAQDVHASLSSPKLGIVKYVSIYIYQLMTVINDS